MGDRNAAGFIRTLAEDVAAIECSEIHVGSREVIGKLADGRFAVIARIVDELQAPRRRRTRRRENHTVLSQTFTNGHDEKASKIGA